MAGNASFVPSFNGSVKAGPFFSGTMPLTFPSPAKPPSQFRAAFSGPKDAVFTFP
jgi:hypothetical protein